jgi:molecular chaperone HtpG
MQEMTKMYGFMNMGMDFNKTEETLLLNKKHSLVNYIIDNHDNDEKTELVSLICEQLYDLAMLSHKPLEPARMTKFVKRSNEILKQLI